MNPSLVGVAEPEPMTLTPYKPDVYALFSKIGHPIGHLGVKLESFTAANIPNGFNLTQTKTNNFKFYFLLIYAKNGHSLPPTAD